MPIVLFSPEVVETIQQEIERYPTVECGGLLLGRVEDHGTTIHVLKSSGSGPKSRHSYTSISPDVDFLNREILKAEMAGLDFLGEWHKHPGNLNSPSHGDVTTITEIMGYTNLKQYLAAIVTSGYEGMEIYTYLFNNGGSCRIVPQSNISTELGNSLISEAKAEADVEKTEKEEIKKHFEEKKKEQRQTDRGIFSWLRRLFKKRKPPPKKEPEVSERYKWPETVHGKEKLSLEKCLMATEFPSFALFEKADIIFWKGAYKKHTIVLKYPPDYPHQPLDIIIEPPVKRIPKEHKSYYATLAAQTALLRIESSMLQNVASSSRLETPVPRKAVPWYETAKGKNHLVYEKRLLDHASISFDLLKLRDGRLVLDVHFNKLDSLAIICPPDYPNSAPRVRASGTATEVKLDIHTINDKISKEWGRSLTSIYSIVREIIRSNKFGL